MAVPGDPFVHSSCGSATDVLGRVRQGKVKFATVASAASHQSINSASYRTMIELLRNLGKFPKLLSSDPTA